MFPGKYNGNSEAYQMNGINKMSKKENSISRIQERIAYIFIKYANLNY